MTQTHVRTERKKREKENNKSKRPNMFEISLIFA